MSRTASTSLRQGPSTDHASRLKGRTSFVIAHRLSTLRDADCVMVIKDGEIIERGTHEQLLEDRGFYHHLYSSQFKDRVVTPALQPT